VTLNGAASIAALTVGGKSGPQTFTTGNESLTIGGPAAVESNGVFALSGGDFDLNYLSGGGSGRIENTDPGLFDIQALTVISTGSLVAQLSPALCLDQPRPSERPA
jgi:hypothetical protein